MLINLFKIVFCLTEKSLNVIEKNITDLLLKILNAGPCFVHCFVECLLPRHT
jgi:hypothetical protein